MHAIAVAKHLIWSYEGSRYSVVIVRVKKFFIFQSKTFFVINVDGC